jgi:hypothetical protein
MPFYPSESMMPLHPSESMMPLHPSESMMPLHPSESMMPLHPSESMIPLHPSESMIPLISVDVVICFLLEVERLLLVVVLLRGSWSGSFSHQVRPFFQLRFASLLINLCAIKEFGCGCQRKLFSLSNLHGL